MTDTYYANTGAAAGGNGTTNDISGPNRAFNTLGVAEAALQGTLTDYLVILCDGGSDASSAVFENADWTTTGWSLTVAPHPNSVHNGILDTGKYHKQPPFGWGSGLRATVNNVIFDGLQGVSTLANTTMFRTTLVPSRISNCIAKGDGSSAGQRGVGIGAAAAGADTAVANNNITYNHLSDGIFKEGFSTSTVVVFYNNTSANNGNGLDIDSGFESGSRVYNNVLTGNATDDYNVVGTLSDTDNNVTSDATSPDVDHRNKTVDYTDAPGGDFSTNDLDVVGLGTDLSADLEYAFSDDCIGVARGATWDCGAFQEVSVIPSITSIDTAPLRPNTVGAILTGTDFGTTTGKMWLADGPVFASANTVELNTTSWADTSITLDLSHALGESRMGHYLFAEHDSGGISVGLQVTVSHPDVHWEFREYTTTAVVGSQIAVSDLDPEHPPVWALIHWNDGRTGSSVSGCCGHGVIDLAGNMGYTVSSFTTGESTRSDSTSRKMNDDELVRIYADGNALEATTTFVAGNSSALTSTGLDLVTTGTPVAGIKLQIAFLCGRTAEAHVGLPQVSDNALTGAGFPGIAEAVMASSCCDDADSFDTTAGTYSAGWSDMTDSFCTSLALMDGGILGGLSKTLDDSVCAQYVLNELTWNIPTPTGTTTGCTWSAVGTPSLDHVLISAFWLDGVRFKVGSFTKTTVTPGPVSQTVTTAFHPTGLLLSSGGKNNQNVLLEEAYGNFSWGYAVSPEKQFHGFLRDRSQTTISDKEMKSGSCVTVGVAGTGTYTGTLVAFTFTSFELNWATNNSGATVIGYVLFCNTSNIRMHHVGGSLM